MSYYIVLYIFALALLIVLLSNRIIALKENGATEKDKLHLIYSAIVISVGVLAYLICLTPVDINKIPFTDTPKMRWLFFFFISSLLYITYLKSTIFRRKISKLIDRFNRKDDYRKQVISHLAYIAFVLIGFFCFYFYWYFDLPESKEKISFLSSVMQYFESNGGFVSFYFGFTALFLAFLSFRKNSKDAEYGLLYSKSKEKIKILNNFSKQYDLIGNRSIYHSIISLLKRCEQEKSNDSTLKLLLCSPLVDFKERTNNIDEWGDEFEYLLKRIAGNKNTKVELYHLPNKVILGHNPLMSFTEVLSNYISDGETDKDKIEDYNKIWTKTEDIIEHFDKMDKRNKSKVTFNRTILNDVPFQIIIYESKTFNEVVVSFAGKRNLEDANYKEPYGFHSVDEDVVKAFEKIFQSYIQENRRSPIKPKHTLDIINKTEEKGEHKIPEYLKSERYQNVIDKFEIDEINLTIPKDTFSPHFANSSKFTSLVIKTILGENDCILEIGAGSGVQSIVGYNTLKKLGTPNPKVYALEIEESFESLKDNLIENTLAYDEANDKGIIAIKGELKSKLAVYDFDSKLGVFKYENNGDKKVKERSTVKTDSKNQEIYNTIINDYEKEIVGGKIEPKNEPDNVNLFNRITPNSISFLIADLPYVDTNSNTPLERAYFDAGHFAHKALFKFFKSSPIISSNARLLTSFSTLGGIDDVIRFELLIKESGLYINHKQAFYEDGFEWIVYSIHKEKDFNWKDYLNTNIV